jgi:inorganic pyrophosphatase
MANLARLALFDGHHVRCVVESPRGSSVKLKYEPALGVFALSRPLLKGLTYPFDWGFLPSTVGDDGDPLDVMLFHDSPTFPGLVAVCRLIGVLEVRQKGERNDRFFAVPVDVPREREIHSVTDLSRRMRDELVEFFHAAAALENKQLKVVGWRGPKRALELLREGAHQAAKRQKAA